MTHTVRLGIFIVATLLLLTAGVFLIGNNQFLFQSRYRLNADFDSAAGLAEGAEVRVAGIREGTVKAIDLPRHANDKVRVEMQLAGKTRDVIRKDSVATIKSQGMVGDMYLEISFGSEAAARVKDGDTIRGQPPLEISDLIKKTNDILDTTQEAVQRANDAVGNLDSITTKVNQGQGTVGALINNKKLYQNVTAGASAFTDDMEALKHNFFLKGFFKRRGYDTAADLTKNEIRQVPKEAPSKTFDFDAKKLFDKADSAEAKDTGKLNDAGKYLQNYDFGLAVIAVSADMKGDSQKDRLLTEARSMVIRDYLVKNFKLEDSRVKTIGLGKSNQAPDGGAVQILVYPQGTAAAQNSGPREH